MSLYLQLGYQTRTGCLKQMPYQTMTDKELKKPAVVNTQEKTRGESNDSIIRNKEGSDKGSEVNSDSMGDLKSRMRLW